MESCIDATADSWHSLLQGAVPYSSLVLCKATETDPGSSAGWSSLDSGNYSPLPQPVCREHTCRGHTIQVLPSHQRIRQPGKLKRVQSRWTRFSLSLSIKLCTYYSRNPSRSFCPHRRSYGLRWRRGRSTWWCLIIPPAPLSWRSWTVETSLRLGEGFHLFSLVRAEWTNKLLMQNLLQHYIQLLYSNELWEWTLNSNYLHGELTLSHVSNMHRGSAIFPRHPRCSGP